MKKWIQYDKSSRKVAELKIVESEHQMRKNMNMVGTTHLWYFQILNFEQNCIFRMNRIDLKYAKINLKFIEIVSNCDEMCKSINFKPYNFSKCFFHSY